ncbi:MAG: helix-turn-helix domain-containing protein [Faecousia sp.]
MYRMLIVDKPQVCREILGMGDWSTLGFERILTAHTLSDAIEQAAAHQPQVALVGMELEGRMGFELVSLLRELGLPTVCCLLTNHPGNHDLRRAMRSGCRDVLRQPPDPLSLREFLEWVVVEELHGALGPGETTERDPVLGVSYSSLGKLTNKILLAVRTDFREPMSLTAVARDMEMSSKYLGRVFLRETGMRFTQYLTAYRMIEARRLIVNTGEKVSVIAGMVGYPQLNNFYTHFRKYFGVSPSVMRATPNKEEKV